MKHNSAYLLLATVVIAACTSCAVTNSDNPLVGQWAGKSGAREVIIALHPNGSCDGLEPGMTLLGTWTQKGPNVVITFDGDVLHGGLISRREMLLTKESSGQTITLVKTGKKTLAPKKVGSNTKLLQ
jgi:hypothetical protein